ANMPVSGRRSGPVRGSATTLAARPPHPPTQGHVGSRDLETGEVVRLRLRVLLPVQGESTRVVEHLDWLAGDVRADVPGVGVQEECRRDQFGHVAGPLR